MKKKNTILALVAFALLLVGVGLDNVYGQRAQGTSVLTTEDTGWVETFQTQFTTGVDGKRYAYNPQIFGEKPVLVPDYMADTKNLYKKASSDEPINEFVRRFQANGKILGFTANEENNRKSLIPEALNLFNGHVSFEDWTGFRYEIYELPDYFYVHKVIHYNQFGDELDEFGELINKTPLAEGGLLSPELNYYGTETLDGLTSTNNPYTGCSGHGNCTFGAWEFAKRNWGGVTLPPATSATVTNSWGDPDQWCGRANAAGYSIPSTIRLYSVGATYRNGTYRHARFVNGIADTGRVKVSEQRCGWSNTWYGTSADPYTVDFATDMPTSKYQCYIQKKGGNKFTLNSVYGGYWTSNNTNWGIKFNITYPSGRSLNGLTFLIKFPNGSLKQANINTYSVTSSGKAVVGVLTGRSAPLPTGTWKVSMYDTNSSYVGDYSNEISFTVN